MLFGHQTNQKDACFTFLTYLFAAMSDKTLKRQLERARKALREAGIELPSGKKSRTEKNAGTWTDGSWGAGSWGSGSWQGKDDKKNSRSGGWESWESNQQVEDEHWSAEPSSSSTTVPPPPKPVKTEQPANVKIEQPAEKPALAPADVPDYMIYTFGREKSRPPATLHVELDAEVIRSHSADKETWSCCGLNGSIMLEIATHPKTQELLEQLYDGMISIPEDNKPANIGIRCRAGRHRSVALATLITDALMSVNDGHVPLVSYMHVEEINRPHCGCPDDCYNVRDGKILKFVNTGISSDALKAFWLENGNAAIIVFRRLWATVLKRKAGVLF